jgi:hypothetical protein
LGGTALKLLAVSPHPEVSFRTCVKEDTMKPMKPMKPMDPIARLTIQRDTLLRLTGTDLREPQGGQSLPEDTLLEPTCTQSGTVCHYC